MANMVDVPAGHKTVGELIAELGQYAPNSPVMYGLMVDNHDSARRPTVGAPVEYDAWFAKTGRDVNRIGSPVVVIYFMIDSAAPATVIDPPSKL